MATASPSRLIEEYYKILRSGYAEQTFRGARRASPARSGDAGNPARREEPGAVGRPGGARCVSTQVRSRAGDAAQPGAARHAADPARPDAATASGVLRDRSRTTEDDGRRIEPGNELMPRCETEVPAAAEGTDPEDRHAADCPRRYRAAAPDAVAASRASPISRCRRAPSAR